MERQRSQTAKFIILLISSAFIILIIYFVLNKKLFKSSDLVMEHPFQISKVQLKYKFEINKLVIPQQTDEEFALSQLKKMFAMQKIMEKYGWFISEEKLLEEQKRIENNTRSPGLLNRIKNIKGFDESLYRDIFVRETLINRTIYSDFYFSTQKIHQDTYRKAQEIQHQIKGKSRDQIKKLIWEEGFEFFDFEVSLEKGLRFSHLPKETIQINSEELNARSKKTEELPEAEIKNQARSWIVSHQILEKDNVYVFDEGESWEVLKVDRFNKETSNARGIKIKVPKKPFNEWIGAELALIEESH